MPEWKFRCWLCHGKAPYFPEMDIQGHHVYTHFFLELFSYKSRVRSASVVELGVNVGSSSRGVTAHTSGDSTQQTLLMPKHLDHDLFQVIDRSSRRNNYLEKGCIAMSKHAGAVLILAMWVFHMINRYVTNLKVWSNTQKIAKRNMNNDKPDEMME